MRFKRNAHYALYLMSLRLTHSPIQSITNSKVFVFHLVCVCVFILVWCIVCYVGFLGERSQKKPENLSLVLLCVLVLFWWNAGAFHGVSVVAFCTTSLVPSSWSSLPLLLHMLVFNWKPKNPRLLWADGVPGSVPALKYLVRTEAKLYPSHIQVHADILPGFSFWAEPQGQSRSSGLWHVL